jgi:hypothetical protein
MTAQVIDFAERLNARRTVEQTLGPLMPPRGKRRGDKVRHRLLKRQGTILNYLVEERQDGPRFRLAVQLPECVFMVDPDEVDPIP